MTVISKNHTENDQTQCVLTSTKSDLDTGGFAHKVVVRLSAGVNPLSIGFCK